MPPPSSIPSSTYAVISTISPVNAPVDSTTLVPLVAVNSDAVNLTPFT